MRRAMHKYKFAAYAPMRVMYRDIKPSYFDSFIQFINRLLKLIKAL